MARRQVNIDQVISIYKSELDKAMRAKYVIYPFSYALYQTWKYIDKIEKARKRDES